MSIPITIPVGAAPVTTQNSFTAVFNADTPGRYDFTAAAANKKQTAYVLDANCVYILHTITFSMTTDEGSMQKSIDQSLGFPQIIPIIKSKQQPLYTNNIKLTNYLDDTEMVRFFHSTQEDDELQLSFEGLFRQRGDLVGQVELTAFVQLVLFEIGSTMWTGKYFDFKTDLGDDLNFRGA